MSRNSHSDSTTNQYTTLADKVDVEELSLHTISDNSNSTSTEEALADKTEQQHEIKLLEDNIREISSVLINYSYLNTN